jgi:hypothetical protein
LEDGNDRIAKRKVDIISFTSDPADIVVYLDYRRNHNTDCCQAKKIGFISKWMIKAPRQRHVRWAGIVEQHPDEDALRASRNQGSRGFSRLRGWWEEGTHDENDKAKATKIFSSNHHSF